MEEKYSEVDIKKRLYNCLNESGLDKLSETELLEALMSYCAPKDKAAETAKKLLDYFDGNFEQIFYADIETLVRVDGISRNAAAFLHLVRDVKKRILLERNEGIKSLNSIEECKEYINNVLCNLSYERFSVISLSGENEIINCSDIAEGTVNLAEIEPMKLVKCVMNDGADSVIIAHNHPGGYCSPSTQDVKFTNNVGALFNRLGIKLKDHLIVGKDGVYSMRESGTIGD